MPVQPWWEHLNLRDEIAQAKGNVNDVQMSLYRAVHRPDQVPYSVPSYYSDITYPTSGLVDLLANVAVRLGSSATEAAKPVWRGDQAMGGGKSHGLVGLYHLANDPEAFRATDLGELVWREAARIAGEQLPADLGNPIVVVLPCDELDPVRFDKNVDGIAETLAERWLWRLVGENTEQFKQHRDSLGTKEGITGIISAMGRPVLTLVDEILDYVQKSTATDQQTEGTEVPIFTKMLFEATKNSPHAAAVIVMISSEDDRVSLTGFGETIRSDLEGQMYKYASVTTTTTGADFASIIRRRLFDNDPDPAVMKATADHFAEAVQSGPKWTSVFDEHAWWKAGAWSKEVARCYPFHPDVMALIGGDWARQAGFQKVRSTLQIFSAAVWTLTQRAQAGEWVPDLIGMGDLPLSDPRTREAITNSGVVADHTMQVNFREIAISDVVNDQDDSGNARRLDLNRPADLFTDVNPRVAERMATALFLTSLTPRAQGAIGATEAELACTAFVPDSACALPAVESVRQTLEDPTDGLATIDSRAGKGGLPRRLLLSTKMTLPMFLRQQRAAVEEKDVNATIRTYCQQEAKSGPFDVVDFVSAESIDIDDFKGQDKELTEALKQCLLDHGVDDARKTRLYILDPYGFTLLNGQDSETRKAIGAALGLNPPSGATEWWPAAMPVAWPSSAVFSVVNTQKRKTVRASARDLVALQRVAEIPAIADDEALNTQVGDDIREAKDRLVRHLRSAFQHVVFLKQETDANGSTYRLAGTEKITKDNETALNGQHVWAYLVEAQKAYAAGDFDKIALLHQLQLHPGTWGQPLQKIRDDFYKTPRLSLLPNGDTDLQRAIFDAVQAGDARVLAADGQEAHASSPAEVNLGSTNTLAKPVDPDAVVPDFVGLTVAEAKARADELGLDLEVSGTGTGVVEGQNVAPGVAVSGIAAVQVLTKAVGAGGGGTPGGGGAPTGEKEIAFSKPGITFGDPAKNDALYSVFMRIAEAAEQGGQGGATFMQVQVKLTGGSSYIEELAAALKEADIPYSLKDMP